MTQKEIVKLNVDIMEGIYKISNKIITADTDAENISYNFRYDAGSLFDSLIIFKHIWCSVAIHNGILKQDNIEKAMTDFRESIKRTFGIDTRDLCKTVIDQLNGIKSTENSVEK